MADVRYFRRRWDEERGDSYSAWGHSWWHFATDNKGVVMKQVEIYDNGTVLVYDEQHPEDEYGGLSLVPLDLADFEPYAIDADAFQREAGRLARRVP
jgi:hypothetical protein